MGTRTPGVQAAIATLDDGARVLDAACGVGFDALSLHRRGFRVTATDASPSMVEQCRARLVAADIEIPVTTCAWAELPDRFGPTFDAALCTGNSLAHAPTRDARRAALTGFAGVLVADGPVILDSQDWTDLHRRGSHTDHDPLVVQRDRQRVTRRFTWEVPERFGELITLTLTLSIDGDTAASHVVTFHPFTVDTLVEDLHAVGLSEVTVSRLPGDDRFAVVARR